MKKKKDWVEATFMILRLSALIVGLAYFHCEREDSNAKCHAACGKDGYASGESMFWSPHLACKCLPHKAGPAAFKVIEANP